MGKNNVKNKVRPQNKHLKPFKAGKSGNPNGRPLGQRNYAVIYREALERIGEAKGKTPEEIETMMEEVGLEKGLKGNFAFWKDIRDRVHGKPKESVDLTSKGKSIVFMPAELMEKHGITSSTKDDSEMSDSV